MAAKSFVKKSDIPLFKEHFEQCFALMESSGENWQWLIGKLSLNLEHYLIDRLSKISNRDQVQIISLGSWSRSELCPRSDVDVILLGSDENITKFVSEAESLNIFLKYRTPEDIKDWSVGVHAFDRLALMFAVSVDKSAQSVLSEQKDNLWSTVEQSKYEVIDLMFKERQARNKRYDSLANYLEPNIKYGPGALRDIQQSLVATELYPELFVNYKKEVSSLINIKSFLLVVRYLLHLEGGGDKLSASLQQQIYKVLGSEKSTEFTSQLQKSLSEIDFYTRWVYELTQINIDKHTGLLAMKIENFTEAMELLTLNPSVLNQERVKSRIKSLPVTQEAKSNFVNTFNQKACSEKQIVAFFGSGLMYKLFPNLERVKGLVQYDHYHRYTVDAHTLQALRFYFKAIASPEDILGLNSVWLDELTNDEHDILIWSLLYHDMAKGLKGSHSELGAELVVSELTSFGFKPELYTEVAWLVKNHLILSEAAFRKNPQSPSTWQWLSDKGMNPRRLKVLCLLTAIDIMATNIEAWTPWKSELLHSLVKQVLSPQVSDYVELTKKLDQLGNSKQRDEYIQKLEPMIVASVPAQVFTSDFKALISKGQASLPILVHKIDEKYSWVRFHSYDDKKGLFLDWSKLLYTSGCAVREAYVNTLPSFGAYNWFKVKTRKSEKILLKHLQSIDMSSITLKDVEFNSIKLIDSTVQGEWILRFKGEDQEGALLGAVQKVFDNDLEIIWARVHTWGDILEDVFAVTGKEENVNKLIRV